MTSKTNETGLSNIFSGLGINNEASILELIDNSLLGPGLESEIKIYLKNIGSIDLNDVQLNLLHSGYSIDIIQGIVNYEYISCSANCQKFGA